MAGTPLSWHKLSLRSRLVASLVIAALMADDLHALLASGRDSALIGVFCLAYAAVMLIIWLPSWSWALVALVTAAGAFVTILAPVLFVAVAAGYALAMAGARRQAALLGLGITGSVFIGMICDRFPRTLWWTAPVVFLASVGVGALVALARDNLTRLAVRTEVLAAAEDEVRLRERAMIAADLHDGLGQSLALISLTAGAAGASQSVDELQQALGETAEIARDARDQMHELANALSPLWPQDCLDAAGIPLPSRVLTKMQDKLASAGRPFVSHVADELDVLPTAARDLCCRVLWEGTTNVLQHAGPGLVEIAITQEDSERHVGITSPLSCRECESPNAAAGRGLTVLTRLATEQGARLTAGPIGDCWHLELALHRYPQVTRRCEADECPGDSMAGNGGVVPRILHRTRFEPIGRAMS